MSPTTRAWQRHLENWKQKANHLISGTEEMDERIELDPVLLEKCKQLADAEETTLNDVVHHILEQYWNQRTNELSIPISREHIERNPLFLLDSLTERNFKPFGREDNSYEQL